MERRYYQQAEENNENNQNNNEDHKQHGGFNRPIPVPNEFLELLGLLPGTELSRVELTKRLYQYIHDNHLQTKMVMGADGVMKLDKRIIVPNGPLRRALMLREGEELNFKNFQHQLSICYRANNH